MTERYKGAPLLTWIGFSYCCFTSSLDDKTFRWSSSNFFKLVLDSVRIISRLILKSHRTPPLVDTPASCADQRVGKSELVVWLSLCFPPLHWTDTWALNSLQSKLMENSFPRQHLWKGCQVCLQLCVSSTWMPKKSSPVQRAVLHPQSSALAHLLWLKALQKCFWVAGLHKVLPATRTLCRVWKGLEGSINWMLCKLQP